MIVQVHHKAGTPWPNFKAAWRVFWFLLFKNKVNVVITFDRTLIDAQTGSLNWLKVCGWKSGARTESNNEELIGFRVTGEVAEFCNYKRRHKKLSFLNKKARGLVENAQSIEYTVQKRKDSMMRYPAIPWAEGGGKTAKGDFSYLLELREVQKMHTLNK